MSIRPIFLISFISLLSFICLFWLIHGRIFKRREDFNKNENSENSVEKRRRWSLSHFGTLISF